MIDAEDFLKGRLEQIQDRNAFGGHYDDGQPHLLQNFIDDQLHGVKKAYDKKGSLVESKYEMGKKL